VTATPPGPGEYVIDTARSTLSFTTKHFFGLGAVRGGFALREGTLSITDPLTNSQVRAIADATSFDTGNPARDSKVVSSALLDAESHPDIAFTSTGVKIDHNGPWTLHGLLTARGVEAPVSFTVQQAQVRGDEIEVTATSTVDRYAHGITGFKGLAARHLGLTVSIHARRTSTGSASSETKHKGRHTMSNLKIAVILGSTRPGRNGEAVANWVIDRAGARAGVDYELVDLLDYPLPLLDEMIPPSMGQYQGGHTKAWAAKIAEFDGYIFVTPEYNHSTSGVLKNAIDYIYGEWNNKAAAFVSYGSLGGARAIEHLRAIASELQLAHVRQQLSFSLFTDFENFSVFKPGEQHDAAATTLFEQLESWATALKTVRG
jgi:NAD(P)H-dependent FMN reductase/polyisoprenoid-binding protein YceI